MVLAKVDIPVNGPADVILLIVVLIFCIFAARIIAGFFKKPAVKYKEDAGGDHIEGNNIQADAPGNGSDR